jgi:hypothetical protein
MIFAIFAVKNTVQNPRVGEPKAAQFSKNPNQLSAFVLVPCDNDSTDDRSRGQTKSE